MNKFMRKCVSFLVISGVFIAGGLTLVAVGTYGDYARHDRAKTECTQKAVKTAAQCAEAN